MIGNNIFNLSNDSERKFAIDVAASPHQAMVRSSVYTVKVSYSCLSKTIHSIGRRGGKVLSVRMLSTPLPDLEQIPVVTPTHTIAAPAATQSSTKTSKPPQPESRRRTSKSKKR